MTEPNISQPLSHNQISSGIAAELQPRRELALLATSAISEVLEVDVSVPALLRLTQETEEEDIRLAAERALRCITGISKENSAVMRTIGKSGIYPYVEGVINFGANEARYLELMHAHGLTAQEATAIYALRELVADYSDGSKPGLKTLLNALGTIGISPQEAATDPEAAVAAMDEAGYFLNYLGRKTFDRPIFSPPLSEDSERLVDDDPDGSLSRGIRDALLEQRSLPPEERED